MREILKGEGAMDNDMVFAQGWTVQITSSGSDYEVVAICPL
jgi:hypothetical protein